MTLKRLEEKIKKLFEDYSSLKVYVNYDGNIIVASYNPEKRTHTDEYYVTPETYEESAEILTHLLKSYPSLLKSWEVNLFKVDE